MLRLHINRAKRVCFKSIHIISSTWMKKPFLTVVAFMCCLTVYGGSPLNSLFHCESHARRVSLVTFLLQFCTSPWLRP